MFPLLKPTIMYMVQPDVYPGEHLWFIAGPNFCKELLTIRGNMGVLLPWSKNNVGKLENCNTFSWFDLDFPKRLPCADWTAKEWDWVQANGMATLLILKKASLLMFEPQIIHTISFLDSFETVTVARVYELVPTHTSKTPVKINLGHAALQVGTANQCANCRHQFHHWPDWAEFRRDVRGIKDIKKRRPWDVFLNVQPTLRSTAHECLKNDISMFK